MAEYRSCRVSNPAQKILPSFWAASLFTVVFCLSCGCLNFLFTQKYWHPDLGIIDSKLHGFSDHEREFNLIVVGPSHLDFGFNPLVFDEVLTGLGHDIRSY